MFTKRQAIYWASSFLIVFLGVKLTTLTAKRLFFYMQSKLSIFSKFRNFSLWFAVNLLPPFLLILLLVHFVSYQDSLLLKLSAFLFYFGLGLFSVPAAVGFLAFSSLWFELPTLMMGFPNQFVIDIAAIGVTSAIWIKRQNLAKDNTFPPGLYFHPFPYLVIFSTFASVIIFPTFVGQLKYLAAEVSPHLFGLAMIRHLFYWDIDSPFHGASMIFGYGIQSVLVLQLFVYHKTIFPKLDRIIECLIWGALPAYVISIFQLLNRDELYSKYSVDPGGTLQNGNHLSFVAALNILLIIYLALRKQKLGIPHLLLLLMTMAALIIGVGRYSWVGLGLSLAVMYGIGCCFKPDFFKRTFKLFSISTLCSFTGILAIYCLIYWISPWSVLESLILKFQGKAPLDLFFISGRKEHLDLALSYISKAPWVGYGPGSFLMITHSFLDIHNVFVAWVFQFGLLGALALFLSGLPLLTIWFEAKFFNTKFIPKAFFLGIVVIISGSLLLDTYLSYRSMSLFVALVLTYFLIEVNPTVPKILSSRYLTVFALLGLCSGMIIFTKNRFLFLPLDAVSKTADYAFDDQTGKRGSYLWASQKISRPITSGQCVVTSLKSSPFHDTSKMSAYLTARPGRAKEFSVTEKIAKPKSFSKYEPINFYVNQRWLDYCFCLPDSSLCQSSGHCQLEIATHSVAILSSTINIAEDRVIGFGFRGRDPLKVSLLDEKNMSHCAYFANLKHKVL